MPLIESPATQSTAVVLHQGVYKKTASLAEAVFMITGLTIGAGILGLPYAVARVGLIPGTLCIIFIGLLMLAMNLMIGEVATATKTDMQLPGLAGKYLGGWAKGLLSVVLIFGYYGTLLAYLVGESISLRALIGGSELLWGVIFWSLASFVVWSGLRSVKNIDKIVSTIVMGLIIGVSLYLLPKGNFSGQILTSGLSLNLPIGVIIFALHATPAIAQAHALLPKSRAAFRKALIIGTLIPIALYVLFTVAVVGIMGVKVPEVATVGIGEYFGPAAVIIANLFAILAMTTCYIGLGTALKETFVWDHKIPDHLATFLVVALPLMLFLAGLRHFVAILDIVGGVFVTIELFMMAAVFYVMKRRRNI
ncbi:MAG: hypothetical protein A3I29_01840 [Candidatus Magasanikbacteria bacterium RIFCSPLOWO2_02_FULL_44_11]|uniref:Amino acid transporter transmembrane domain-containing protein n=2 Tax=Candidatus Magasanikiibacteriota TaxID=1752731 RepID=A0A1F6NAM1_9BACT|nr:MAG: hypothetical protein A3D53_02765 [Candidatus Magasanikbacteria bacterium RIFCSPHIGHO2_02_FULL_45_10]OGH80919.1 MAG: hypothetical protein A3I29_01840 [Candidatus Magasanikbacteria bacterium RIFCSPLOWO2_02_FULL_44_11]